MINVGQVLNDTYEIRSRIGSGGGGIIFKAYHRRMRKFVAIKLIKDDIKGRLQNRSEVDVLKNLKNDYLPQVHDFIEDGNDVYTVMEFIDGKNFKQLVKEGNTFSEAKVRKYALQLCTAVKYLHSHVPPIIHSDIKPANIMLTPQDNICLIDFNISMFANEGIADSKGGSEYFGAPEQFRRLINTPNMTDEFHEQTRFISGDDEDAETVFEVDSKEGDPVCYMNTKNIGKAYIDVRTDIYGIGASLYYILTGRVPQEGKPDFRGIKVSSQMTEIISEAMNPDPNLRFRNISELENALNGGNQSKSKKKIIAVTSCAAALSLVVVFGIILGGKNNESMAVSDNVTASTTSTIMNESVISDETSAVSVEKDNTSEGIDDNSAIEQIAVSDEIYGVLSYYDNGSPECEKGKLGTGYTLLWFDPDGTGNKLEYYDENDKLYRVDTCIGGEWIKADLELIEKGYVLTVERTDRTYPYMKYVINFDYDRFNAEKVVFCDENKNEMFYRTVETEYYIGNTA